MSKSTIIMAWVVCLAMLIASLFLYNYYGYIGHWSSWAWGATCIVLALAEFVLTPCFILKLIIAQDHK